MRRLLVTGMVLSTLMVTAACGNNTTTEQFPVPTVGSSGTFQYYPQWEVSGTVTVANAQTLHFTHFTFHGDGLTAILRLQKNDRDVAELMTITDSSYTDATFDVSIPATVGLNDFNVVTVFSPSISSPVSGAAFTTPPQN